MALLLGHFLNHEQLTLPVICGTGLIHGALLLYEQELVARLLRG